jgi:hypothetical protein
MSRIQSTAAVALTLALLTPNAFAQRAGNSRDSGGETTTVRTEQTLTVSIEVPQLPTAQCEATANTEYRQQNTVALVESTLSLSDCPAGTSGELTFAVRVRDDSGEVKPLEFKETWERSDDQDVAFNREYPIGENVELLSVRMRGLVCTCTAAPGAAAGPSETASPSDEVAR